MDLLAELKTLIAALEAERVEYALCGAVALAVHGAPRATRDIDLPVPEGQLEAFGGCALRGAAFGWALEHAPVVSREGLISLKLLAGRPQDLVDVQRIEELNHG